MQKKETTHESPQKGGHSSASSSNYEMLYGVKKGQEAGAPSIRYQEEDHEKDPQAYSFTEWMRINRSGIENPFVYLQDSPLVKMLMERQSLRNNNTVQAKLKVNKPGDEFEKEADRVAEQVVSLPEQTVSRELKDKEEEEDKIAAKMNDNATGMELDPEAEGELGNLDTGKTLSESEREFYEQRFGTDFSGVKIHDNSKAHALAEALNARAFTIGKHIVLGKGEYAPGTGEGKKLMAHELAHVVQRGGKNQIKRALPAVVAAGGKALGVAGSGASIMSLMIGNVSCDQLEIPEIRQIGPFIEGSENLHREERVIIANRDRSIPVDLPIVGTTPISNLHIEYFISYDFKDGALGVSAHKTDDSTASRFDSGTINIRNIRTNRSSTCGECWEGMRSLPYVEFTIAAHIDPVGRGEWWQNFHVRIEPYHEIEIIPSSRRLNPSNT